MTTTVIVTLPTRDAATLEKTINESDQADTILDSARGYGLLTHRFVSGANSCLVIDQWPDEASFNQFFTANEARIRQMLSPVMQGAGAETINVYNNLSTRDQYPQEQGGRHAGR